MEAFGEYDPATPLGKAFCKQVTAKEFEDQGSENTYSALQNLMKYMDEHPEKVKGILAKKMREEQENGGMFTFIKSKLMTSLKGDNYMIDSISRGDCKKEAERLQDEMQQAFNYAQEAKNNGRRFSRRIAARRPIKDNRSGNNTKPPPQAPPPPPIFSPPSGKAWTEYNNSVEKPVLVVVPKSRPPIHRTPSGRPIYRSMKDIKSKSRGATAKSPSPSKLKYRKATPFRERTNMITADDDDSAFITPPKVKPVSKKHKRTDSIVSVHDEIRSFTKENLRSVKLNRSPGRTPCRTPRTKRLVTASNCDQMADYSGVSLTSLQQIIVEKFRNIRSPDDAQSPIDCAYSSPSGFTP